MLNWKNVWDNTIVTLAFIYECFRYKPKRSIAVTLLIAIVLNFLIDRTPNMLSCTWKAVVVQKVPSEKWTFNWLPSTFDEQCRYYNGTRWVVLEKVVDVGMDASSLEDLEQ